jgi:putative endonuclease
MNKRRVGTRYEEVAARFLEEAGYEVVEKNFRTRYGEIDLIVRNESVLAFVEVKMRSSEKYGRPEEAVNPAKQKSIFRMAQIYLSRHPETEADLRFDIVAILGRPPQQEIRHIENAFDASGFFGF